MVVLTPPRDVHAIAHSAHRMWLDGNGVLSAASLAELAEALSRLRDDPEDLLRASISLEALALYLAERGADAAVVRGLRSLILGEIHALEKLGVQWAGAIDDRGRSAARQLAHLTGEVPPPRAAPRMRSKAPAGSVRLGAMIPNPACRRPAKRAR